MTPDEDILGEVSRALKALPLAERARLKDLLEIRCDHWGDERDDGQREIDEENAEHHDGETRAAATAANREGARLQEEYRRAIQRSALSKALSPAQRTDLLTELKIILLPANATPVERSAACLEGINTLLRSPHRLTADQRKLIANILYFRLNGRSQFEITPAGALRILVLTGHILEG